MQPGAGKFRRQAPHFGILEHAAGLCGQHAWITQFSLICEIAKFRIGLG